MQSNDHFNGGEVFDEDDQDFEEIVKGDADFGWENKDATTRKRRTLKKAPEAPKRFKSAYICYVMHKMDEMKQSLEPDIKVTEIMKKLAQMWKTLPALEKKEFEAIADADKSRYFQELATYSGPMQVPNKRRKKNPCAPKRAMSAFLSYSQEMRPRVRDEMPGLKNSDVSVVLAQRWRDASDAEKRPHQERERWDRQKYYQDLAVWKSAEEERVKEEDQERKRVSARDTIDFMDLPSSLLVWGDSSSGQGSGQDSGNGSPHFGPRGSNGSSGSRHSGSGSQSSDKRSHHSSEGSTMQCDVDNSGGAGVRASRVRKEKDKNDGSNKRPRPDDIDNISLSTEQWSSMLGTGTSAMPPPSLFQPINAHVIKGGGSIGGHVSVTSGPRRGSKSSSSGSNGSISQKGSGSSNGGSVNGSVNGSESGHRHGHRDLPLLGVSSISIHGSTAGGRDSRSNAGSQDVQHDEENDRDGTDLGHSPGRTSPDGEGGSECGSEGATDSSSGSSDGADSGLSDRVHRGLSAFVSFMDGSHDSADGSGDSNNGSSGGSSQQRAVQRAPHESADAAKKRRKSNKTKDRKNASVRHRQRQQDSGLAEHYGRPQGLTQANMQARTQAQAQQAQALAKSQDSSPRSFTSQCPPLQVLPQQQAQPQQPSLQQLYKDQQFQQQQNCPPPQQQVQQPFLNVPNAPAGVSGYFCDGGYPFGSNTYGYGGVTRTLFACSSMYNNVPSTGLNMPLYAQQQPTIAPQAQQLAPPGGGTSTNNSVGNSVGSSKVRWDTATTYQYPAYYGGMTAPASIAITAGGDGYGGGGGGGGSTGTSVMTTGENSRSSSAGSRGNHAPR